MAHASTINFSTHGPKAFLLNLVAEGHRGQLDTPRQITTNILPCLGVVWVVLLPGVQVGHPGFNLGDVAVEHETAHPLGDVVAKLLDLLANVAQESVA